MALNKINPKNVRQDPRGLTLWYSEGEKNLLIVHDEKGIIFFEYIDQKKVIEGGRKIPFKGGNVSDSKISNSPIRRARVVDYKTPVEKELVNQLRAEISDAQDFPVYLKQTLVDFLDVKKSDLEFTQVLKDYKPIFKANIVLKVLAPYSQRYGIFRWWHGWFIPIVLGVLFFSPAIGWIVYRVTKKDLAMRCYKMGNYHDCLKVSQKFLVEDTIPLELRNAAIKKMLMTCVSGEEEACGIVEEYVEKYPTDLEPLNYLKANCTKKEKTFACKITSNIYKKTNAISDAGKYELLYCVFLKDQVVRKLDVGILDLNLMIQAKECPERLTIDNKDWFASEWRNSDYGQKICHELDVCAPYLSNFPADMKKIFSGIKEENLGDQKLMKACFASTNSEQEAIFHQLRDTKSLVWKDRETEVQKTVKSIPRFFKDLPMNERMTAVQIWNDECQKNDIKSCFALLKTSEEFPSSEKRSEFCTKFKTYLQNAKLKELLAFRISLKLNGE